jgi:hypothetical protein
MRAGLDHGQGRHHVDLKRAAAGYRGDAPASRVEARRDRLCGEACLGEPLRLSISRARIGCEGHIMIPAGRRGNHCVF